MVALPSINCFTIIFSILLLAGPGSVVAAIDVLIEQDTVSLNESFQISFEIESSSQANPDFAPLQENFDILARSQSTNITMTNGQYRAVTRWTLEVMAKQTGPLTIPAIEFGNERSPSKTITVTQKRPPQQNSEAEEIFFEVDAQPRKPYVQAQVIYTLRLFRAVNTHNSSLSEPQFQGGKVLMEKLGEDRSFETRRDGRRYLVVERKYAIFPQSSGQLSIEPVVFTGKTGAGRRLMLDPLGSKSRVTRARSERVALEVRPIPDTFTGSTWLPANQLQLRDTWTDDPPPFRVGEPVTRTLALIAGGLTSAQLPELNPTIPKVFKHYPDQPSLNSKLDQNGVIGVRQEKIALIPSKEGEFVLPEISIAWWNTETDRMEKATLPPLEVTVDAGAPMQQSQPERTVNLPQLNKSDTAQDAPVSKPELPSPSTPLTWMGISTVLGLGWAITALFWWLSRRTESRRAPSANKRQSAKQAVRGIRQTCARNDPVAAKDALLEWSEAWWPQRAPKSLGMLAENSGGELQDEILRLNRFLYAQASGTWQGDSLWRAFQRQRLEAAVTEPVGNANKLEPIFKI